jgi:hypothetical protein
VGLAVLIVWVMMMGWKDIGFGVTWSIINLWIQSSVHNHITIRLNKVQYQSSKQQIPQKQTAITHLASARLSTASTTQSLPLTPTAVLPLRTASMAYST